MSEESNTMGIKMYTTPGEINYGLFDHVVTFESTRRVCVNCGTKLRRGQRAFGILTNCPQKLPHAIIPSNFFIHADCSGSVAGDIIDIKSLNQKIDEIILEYRNVKDFLKKYGAKWGIKLLRYGDVD